MGKAVSHARSTWTKIKEFQEGIEALEKKIGLPVARYYLLTGKKYHAVSPDIYEEIDRLEQLREQGIQDEMKYCLAQAELNGITLTEEIKTGKDIRPFFSEQVLDKVPSLDLYTHFMWYTGEELEKLKTKQNKDNSQKANPKTSDDGYGEI